MSPFLRRVRSGIILPLMRAPMHWWPTSVWMVYAKSITVASRGSDFTWPFGVKV